MAKSYDEIRTEIKALKKRAKELFTEKSAELFETNPIMKSFGWRQYTPYFNDGDVCEFGVHWEDSSVYVNGTEGYEVEIDTDWKQRDAYRAEVKVKLNLHKKVAKFLQEFDEDSLKVMFEDHASITVHRDGTVDISEYDHD